MESDVIRLESDVIVIGGNFAGVSAAMQLARARKRVVVVDAGQPRNRFASASQGFLGQDGSSPIAIQAVAKRQLLAYPTVSWLEGSAEWVFRVEDEFIVMLGDDRQVVGRKLILASGVRDELPDIAGLQPRWGRSVLHCPYCHGYEIGEGQLGILANHAMAPHQSLLVADWGPVIYFSQGQFTPDEEQRQHMQARGIRIESSPVVAILGNGTEMDAVRLEDGREIAMKALFTAPRVHLNSGLIEQLGCRLLDGPLGPCVDVDVWGRTSVEGVFAAGDIAIQRHNATLASASGVNAGVGAHQSLLGML
ncbi:thioredoxin reductase [Pokkaliibacter plantistimulans]|uniref:Thioredoxin reductase n=1 Tax=Proteobacteria bacterium 228 TaxID=2083153 RepID=A0A2S5KNP5_9PROT|nr:NAD(P)/FAD-dependent oxidoreductase [Pokkaliibacter plantistimulans]PPC76464.1 thioredoxin reductase [Pokkaliibacter plantistimulans]